MTKIPKRCTEVRKAGATGRRRFVAAMLAMPGWMAMGAPLGLGRNHGKRLGISAASYVLRGYASIASTKYPPFRDAMDMIEHCHSLGAGGMQVGVRNWTREFARRVRDRSQQLDLFVEGQIRLPADKA
ncbi:MAG: hypothetical protein OEQ53_20780, partial [Saprospiraceae bacterium]|nr:hypothetical protein [Saprospiraceae bacterium]